MGTPRRSRHRLCLNAGMRLALVRFLLLAPLVCAAPLLAVDSQVAARHQRVARGVRLWGSVRWQHPWLLTREVDWDAALVRALPRLAAAATPAEERAALAGLLADLGDPATRLEEPPAAAKPASQPTPATAGSAGAVQELLPGDVLSLRLVRLPDWVAAQDEAKRLQPLIAAAKSVLLDLRGQPPVMVGVEDVGDEVELLAPALTDRSLQPPALRGPYYSGYPPQSGRTSGGYFSGLLTVFPPAPAPSQAARAPTAKAPLVVVLADSTTPVTTTLLALQRAGVKLVSEGPLDLSWVISSTAVDLGAGLRARLRTAEFEREPTPELTVSPKAKGDAAREAGLALLRGEQQAGATAAPPAHQGPPPREPGWLQEKAFPEMAYPSLEYRWLAVARLWNVIRFFYPYLSLLDRPWDETLLEALPLAEAAADEEAWLHALLQIAARINDSHTGLYGSPRLQALLGQAGVGVKLQLLEGEPVVVGFYGELARKAGVLPGDVIETIDGEPLRLRAGRLERETAASQPRLRTWMATGRALRGAFGSVATLGLRAPDGAVRTVKITRPSPPLPPNPEPEGLPYKKVPGNVGYVDLARLEPEQVDAMFEELFGTRALVFDLRNYPRGAGWPIAPRLNVKGATHAALFQRAQLGGASSGEEGQQRYQFKQLLPTGSKPVYRGRVVVLINEFAISQSEHTGLFFETAADVTFVGSSTQGANGDITNTVLPGGLLLHFTGHDVRHADGRQLQRVGLQPHIHARPTAAGLRAGRDEVLERALEEIGPAIR